MTWVQDLAEGYGTFEQFRQDFAEGYGIFEQFRNGLGLHFVERA